jgi:hypothetical protein
MFDRQSKHYNGWEGQSVEWGKAVTGIEPLHSSFIILNIVRICLCIGPNGEVLD